MRRRVRSTLTTAMALVSAVLVVTGCSSGNSSALPTPLKSPTPSASETSTTSPTPSVAAPTLPAEAKAADPDGAAAFIRHYFEVVNYAQRTGDLAALRPLRSDDCVACQSVEATISEGYADGGHIEGGGIRVGEPTITPGNPSSGLEGRVVLQQAPGSLVGPDGAEREPIQPAKDLLVGMLLEYEDGWTVIAWGKPDAPR